MADIRFAGGREANIRFIPRVAYMELGIYALWGEQQEDTLSRKAQKNLGDSFAHINEEHFAIDTVK